MSVPCLNGIYEPCGRSVLCSLSVWLSSTEVEKCVLKEAESRLDNSFVEFVEMAFEPSVATDVRKSSGC